MPELVSSQVRYLSEPKTWCRMAPFGEKDDVTVSVRVWHRHPPGARPKKARPGKDRAARRAKAAEPALEAATSPTAEPVISQPVVVKPVVAQPVVPAPPEVSPQPASRPLPARSPSPAPSGPLSVPQRAAAQQEAKRVRTPRPGVMQRPPWVAPPSERRQDSRALEVSHDPEPDPRDLAQPGTASFAPPSWPAAGAGAFPHVAAFPEVGPFPEVGAFPEVVPFPEDETLPEDEPGPATTARPTAAPEPEATADPGTAPEPAAEAQPQLRAMPVSEASTEVEVSPEPEPEDESVPGPDAASIFEAAPAPRPTTVSETAPFPEATAFPGATAFPEADAFPEPTAFPEAAPVPEADPFAETGAFPAHDGAPEAAGMLELEPLPDPDPAPAPRRGLRPHRAPAPDPEAAPHRAPASDPATASDPAVALDPAAAARPPAAPGRSMAAKVAALFVDLDRDRPVPSVERALSGPESLGDPSWRRRVKVVAGGQGPGQRDQAALDRERARLPLPGPRRIAVLGCTSGAGQSVMALMTGHTLADVRQIPVAVLDLNPGDSSLAARIEPAASVTALLAGLEADPLSGAGSGAGAARMWSGRGKTRGRLDVIAGDDGTRGLGPDDYRRLAALLAERYPLTMIDPAPSGLTRVLSLADQLVLVTPASPEAATALAHTQQWLSAHGYDELAARAVTVVNGVSRRSMEDVLRAESVARGRCRAIVRVPWDDGLSAGAESPAALQPQTRLACTALAGVLVAGLVPKHPRPVGEQGTLTVGPRTPVRGRSAGEHAD